MKHLDQVFDLQYFAEDDGQSDQGGGKAQGTPDPIAVEKAIREKMGVGQPSGSGEPEKKSFSFIENGKTVELQLTDQEILEHIAKGYNYTGKTQTLAEERKALTDERKKLDDKLEKLLSESSGDDLFADDDTVTPDIEALVKQVNDLTGTVTELTKKQTTNDIRSTIARLADKHELTDDLQLKIAKFGDERNIRDYEVALLAYKGANPEEFSIKKDDPMASGMGAIGGGVSKQTSNFDDNYLKNLVTTSRKERNL